MINFQEGPGIRNWQYVTENGTKFINIRCISDGDINTTNANMISSEEASGKYAHFMLKPYDIVMSCSGTLGRYAIVRPEHLPLCLNTSIIRFQPAKEQRDFAFIYGYLTSKEFLNKQIELACGSVQANFGPIHLKGMNITMPPLELRSKFFSLAMPLIDEILQLKRENQSLAATRDTVLPRLMSGEIDVSEIENEPTNEVYKKYQEFCISTSLQAISAGEFTKQVKSYFNLEVMQKKIKGKKYRIFVSK